MTLGQRIQELRKQAGLSQEGLGEALGVSRQAVSKWEGDNGIPELDTLIAMSRLFGVTLGQLLGVEEAVPPQEEPAPEERSTMDEERLEAILRRYVEESRQHEPIQRNAIGSWIIAACCILASVIIAVVAIWQVREVKQSVNNLWGNVTDIDSTVLNIRNQIGSLSSNVREQINAALEEENNPFSTFEYELVTADLEKQTVTVRFDATLKEYAAGSKLQFLVDWIKVDNTEGQTVSDFVTGPDFTAEVTFPMNYHAAMTLRVTDSGGNIQEREAGAIGSFHPESFYLEAYNLMRPFLITISRRGTTTVTAEGEQAYVDILSAHPKIYWPEQAEITAWVNGKKVFSDHMVITQSEENEELFCAAISVKYYDITMKEGDEFQVMVRVTDNLGRIQEFWEGGVAENGGLERNPMSAPAVSYPD